MLNQKEADVPGLLVALVVLPLVAYFLLGKWKETLEKKESIRVLAQLASEEAAVVDSVLPQSDFLPAVTPSKAGAYFCAWCLGSATTRCSRCKSVRYCSGKCQIVHWRQGHKDECQQLGTFFSTNEPNLPSPTPRAVNHKNALKSNVKVPKVDRVLNKRTGYVDSAVGVTLSGSHILNSERRVSGSGVDLKVNGEMLKTKAAFGAIEKTIATNGGIKTTLVHDEGHVSKCRESALLAHTLSEVPRKRENKIPIEMVCQQLAKGSTSEDQLKIRAQSQSSSDTGSSDDLASKGSSSRSHQSYRNGQRGCHKADPSSNSSNFLTGHPMESSHPDKDDSYLNSPNLEKTSKGRASSDGALNTLETKASLWQKSVRKCSISEVEKADVTTDSKIVRTSAPVSASFKGVNEVLDDKNNIGTRKPLKYPTLASSEDKDRSKRIKEMHFPYEEFVKFFHDDVLDLCPRGLLNCGNSCYANAILQCLTFTKPLITYLLQRCHSRTCCVRDWCLMCELEQHVAKLREGGSPLSPAGILSQLQKIGGRMGSGSQEDAHEFLRCVNVLKDYLGLQKRTLSIRKYIVVTPYVKQILRLKQGEVQAGRLLVASMQSICLSELGGEKNADSRLQETTFIHQTFGGCLRSKVKCLRCHHESERYENIMDLTLEIHGWVESLEDALAQFTSPEDLDGENMYRCGRCSAYVRARKQLNIHDAPNILTIVLKRFQSGKYGKINKCITFPEMLDMIPYTTGTSDIPPLYMLYSVVVHLDTQNASFSGHYVSYVKDLQGAWFRVDDTEVEPVPISQVMSEGTYILFYSRSFPRPPKVYPAKASASHFLAFESHCKASVEKPSQHKHLKLPHPPYSKAEANDINRSYNPVEGMPRGAFPSGKVSKPFSADFSDITSSDCSSIFTSSDDGSLYSTSTMDHYETDILFNSFNIPEHLHCATSCKMFPPSRMETRYFSESNACVLDASMPDHGPGSVHTRKRSDRLVIL